MQSVKLLNLYLTTLTWNQYEEEKRCFRAYSLRCFRAYSSLLLLIQSIMQSFIRAYSRCPMSRTPSLEKGTLVSLYFFFHVFVSLFGFLFFSYCFVSFSCIFRVPPLLFALLLSLEGSCVLIMCPCGHTPIVQHYTIQYDT